MQPQSQEQGQHSPGGVTAGRYDNGVACVPWTTLTPRVAHYKFSQQQLKINAENSSVAHTARNARLKAHCG